MVKVNMDKNWCIKMAELEGDSEISAGIPLEERVFATEPDEADRAAFEADAQPYGYNIVLGSDIEQFIRGEVPLVYADNDTNQRYMGWQACRAYYAPKVTKASEISPAIVEAAMIAHGTERSAQMGEPWYPAAWEEFKRDNPVEYQEEYTQMQCALEAAKIVSENSPNANSPTAQMAIQHPGTHLRAMTHIIHEKE